MSKYTTEVRYICEMYAGGTSGDYDDIDDIVSSAREAIFASYPIFDEQYRPVLEKKILKHYYTREIGEESVGLWKMRLNNKLNEIMPYYNQLYRSELLHFNPFYDIDLSTGHSRIEEGGKTSNDENIRNASNMKVVQGNENLESSTDSSSIGNTQSTNSNTLEQTSDTSSVGTRDSKESVAYDHLDKYSDTPQGQISNLENDTYLTNARIVNDNTDDKANESSMSNENTNAQQTGTSNTNENQSNVTNSSGVQSKENNINEVGTIQDRGTRSGNEDFNSTENYLEHVQGKRGLTSYSELLIKYRDTFLNIDMKVIDELAPLFMNIW